MRALGQNEIVHSESLIIPKGDVVATKFTVGSWEIDAKIVFEDIAPDGSRGPGVEFEPVERGVKIRFIGWNNSLGTAINSPVHLGTTNTGRELLFLACHWRVGNVDRVDIQIMLQGVK